MRRNFDFRYIDRVTERPALKTLICSALKGSFVGCADIMDEAFEGLTKRQKRHFARVLRTIWEKHAKRKARAKARTQRANEKLAREIALMREEEEFDREVRAFVPEWKIVRGDVAFRE